MSDPHPSVAAIVPAYNEAERIGNVLQVLNNTAIINEIIVVDDGSQTNITEKIVHTFPRIKYLRNSKNKGKGYSMERGVASTNASIIFFCDADLQQLTPEIVTAIIQPVVNQTYPMFIGIRNNKMQKAVRAFALNSGERALIRKAWEALPKYYKNGFRIEIGLNYLIKYHTKKGYGYNVFPYYQTLKEVKWGFWKGTKNRWRLYYEVGVAWMRAAFYDRFRSFKLE